MSNYSSLKATIDANVKANNNQEITGAILNSVLNAVVNSMGAKYQYAGVATPDTDPGTPDQNLFYIATTPGTYTNFGGIVVASGECVVLKGTGSTWSKEDTGIDLVSVSQNTSTGHTDITIGSTTTPVASVEEVSQLGQEVQKSVGLSVIDFSKYINSASDEANYAYSPYFWKEQNTLRGKQISAIQLKVKNVGNGTIKIVKATSIVNGGSVSYTEIETLTNLRQGLNTIVLSSPIILDEDEYIGVYMQAGSAVLAYENAQHNNNKEFFYNTSGYYGESNKDLPIAFFSFDETKRNDERINTIELEISGALGQVEIVGPSLQPNRDATTTYNPLIPDNDFQNKIRNRLLTKIGLNIHSPGIITIKKYKNVVLGVLTSSLYSETIVTESIGTTGYYEIDLPNIVLLEDEWLAIGAPADTASIDYNSTVGTFFFNSGEIIASGTGDLLLTIYEKSIDTKVSLLYKGEKLGILGDSITYGYNLDSVDSAYGKKLADKLGMDYISYGINSSTIANVSGHNPMCNRVSSMDANLDLVMLFGGTNDFQNNVPMGTQFTSNEGETRVLNTDTGTFFGAVNVTISELVNRYPNKTIYIITPLHRGDFYTSPMTPSDNTPNGVGCYLSDYVEAIKKAAEYFSVPVIDMYGKSILNPNVAAVANLYFTKTFDGHPDLLHPNEVGHTRLADAILREIIIIKPS